MYELLRKAREGCRESLEEATRQNSGLVFGIARRFEGRGHDFEDLAQVGMIGLVKAIRRFDASLGLKFSTYAVPVITGEIKRFIRDDGIIKVSRRYKELFMEASRVKRELSLLLMREPTIGEIAQRMDADVYTISEAMEACAPCDSINRSINDSDGDEVFLLDKLVGADDSSLADRATLKMAVDSLDEKSRRVIAYRYFMDETQVAVAKRLGISQVQVSRIEKRALKVLQDEYAR